MTEVVEAIILGVVQGLTELLPVSSSAHLYLLSEYFFKWTISDSFDIALHFGTLLAICIFFFKDWISLIKGGFNKVFKKEDSTEGRIFWYIVAATIPAGIIGIVFEHYLEGYLKQPLIVATALIVMGILLYVVDKKSKSEVSYENMTFKQAFLIGISQVLAFIPGVSRSGATITVGRALKVDRESVAKYTFLLSTPIVFAATVLKIFDFQFSVAFFAGVLTSFLVGLAVIKFLMEFIKKRNFKVFAIYRVLLGIVVYITFFVRMMH
jgi:undecaprenyl-diphosphatase